MLREATFSLILQYLLDAVDFVQLHQQAIAMGLTTLVMLAVVGILCASRGGER